ncbi:SH2 domain-containing protein 7 isoform X2 [Narcine bancroftii]|uniref:SH2 domain-containing protein 7 isoform X2 n=1 Tax=Narcine bancroftii TaxID=1343680 RepID=UPI003831A9E9
MSVKGHTVERMGDSQKLTAHTPKWLADPETLGVLKEMALKWFAETQTELVLQNGRLPEWFHGFVTRKEAENLLWDKGIGHFLIRLSDRATGYILSYRGTDRCRHFVIHQLKDRRYMIDGSNYVHNGLAALIDYYMAEAIQPFGEVLTEACSQYDRGEVYDHISSGSLNSPCSADVKEATDRRPLPGYPPYPQQEPTGERQPRRLPAVPPKSTRVATANRLPSSESASIGKDSDVTSPVPNKMKLAFEEEKQVEAKYGQVIKFKSRKPPCDFPPAWKTQTHSLSGEKVDKRKPINAVYSLAMEPIHNKPFKPMSSSSATDVVYTEVDVDQWWTNTSLPGSLNHIGAASGPTEHVENKHMSLGAGPSTPPRLSPNLNSRSKSSSPTNCAQKSGASQSFLTTLRPLPQPGDGSDRPLHKPSMSSTENTYEQVPLAFSKRGQTKPDKDEIRKRWFLDWKCK